MRQRTQRKATFPFMDQFSDTFFFQLPSFLLLLMQANACAIK